MEELDVQAFRSWLASHADEGVWMAGSRWELCPLARWLRETRGGPWWVGLESYGPGGTKGGLFSLPEWASRFVDVFDQRYAAEAVVTGGQVLVVLDEVVALWVEGE